MAIKTLEECRKDADTYRFKHGLKGGLPNANAGRHGNIKKLIRAHRIEMGLRPLSCKKEKP